LVLAAARASSLAESIGEEMTLNVNTSSNSYSFFGPFGTADGLQAKSGVYVITTKTSDESHKVIDVGESGDVQRRVSNHDRAQEWKQHMQTGLFVSAHYCDEPTRMTVEADLRRHFNPPCGHR
jgi:hypothetical protein